MLLTIQFPIADLRGFSEDSESGRLRKPAWPFPVANADFVRGYGTIRNRPKGGLMGWVGENEVCKATKSIRLSGCPRLRLADSKNTVPIRIAFRRYFFDGLAVGKVELGFATKSHTSVRVEKDDLKKFIDKILHLKVRVKIRGEYVECQLQNAGNFLAQSYLASTTYINHQKDIKKWQVGAGVPLLFLNSGGLDQVSTPYPSREVNLPSTYDFNLGYYLVPSNGNMFQMWFMNKLNDFHSDQARNLRIYLLRLHAEHECLQHTLRNIMAKNLIVTARSEQSNALQHYFNEATKRIGLLEQKASALGADEIAGIARESMDLLNPGQRYTLRSKIDQLDILDMRKNIDDKMKTYVKNLIINERGGLLRVVNGDNFGDVTGSVIATRNSTAEGVINLKNSGNTEVADAISELDELIAETPDDDLSPEEKQKGAELLQGITEETNKQQPNKNILEALGTTLLSVVTSVSPLAKAGKAAFDIIKTLWA